MPLAPGKSNELCPLPLIFSPDAREAWIGFVDHVERALAQNGPYEAIRPLANKLGENAARLAGVLAVIDDPDTKELSHQHLAAGIVIAQHFAAEALRLSESMRVDPELAVAQRVLQWLRQDWFGPVVSLIELYQRGPYVVREAKSARRVATLLEDHGWLQRIDGGYVVNGTFRREVWRIWGKA
jgi:hypothetical protein